MMKRLCSLVLVLAMLLTLVPAAFAAAKEVDVGDTGVTVTFEVKSETAYTVTIGLSYSDAAFEWVSASGATQNPTSGTGNYVFGDNSAAIGTATGTMVVDVKKSAPAGEYTFTALIVSALDKNGDSVSDVTVTVDTVLVKECTHQNTNWVVTKAPTCIDTGEQELRCVKCEKVLKTLSIEATHVEGHTAVVVDAAVPATCTTNGKTEGSHCTGCGAVIVKQEEIKAPGHNYVDGVCSECKTVNPAYGYAYEVTSATTCTVTDYSGGQSNLTIASELGGCAVTAIDSYAFVGGSLKGVTVPSTVTTIGANAFSGCTALTSAYLTANVGKIGDNAFPAGCTIYCYTGSYAETWATNNGYTVVLLDASKDIEVKVNSPVTMNVGDTLTNCFDIVASVDYTTTYTSNNTDIVEVDAGGKMTAKATGTAIITLLVNSVSTSLTVNVREKLTSFVLDKTEVWAVPGDTIALSITDVKPAGTTPILTWSSNDVTLATVTDTGVVTANFAGDAIITVSDMDGVSAQCVVHITEAVTAVSFAETAVSGEVNTDLGEADTIQLIANVECGTEKYTNELVEFTTSDPSVATVDEKGLVTCVGAGTATITAKSKSLVSDTCTVTVTAHSHTPEAFGGVEANCENGGFTAGSRCADCGFVITAPVATTALGHDTTLAPVKENIIPSTCTDGGTYDEVKYCKRCGVELSRTAKTTAATGHTMVDEAAIAPSCKDVGYTACRYCSVCKYVEIPRTEVAKLAHTVVEDPYVAPTYTTEGHTKGSHCSVCLTPIVETKVIPKLERPNPTGVTVSPADTVVLLMSDTATLTATIAPAEAKPDLTWTSSVPTVATVDANGLVTAVGYGTTMITVTTVNNKTATVKVVVTKPEDAGAIVMNDGASVIKHTKDTFTLGYTLVPSSATSKVTFTSSNPAVVKVNEDGSLTALQGGSRTVTITATADTGATATIKVTVHSVTITAGKAATCEAEGKTEGRRCSACGVIEAQTVIPALGHVSEIIPAVDATCTKTGTSEGAKCLVCKKVLLAPMVVPMTAHVPVADLAVLPTCTTNGLTAGTHCKDCGAVITAQTLVPATGHTAGTPVMENNKAATCMEEGGHDTVTYCTVCTAEMSRVHTTIEKAEHTVVIIPGKAATATTPGLTDGKKCTVCEKILQPQTIIPPIGGDRLPGDVNGDGVVNGKDSVALLQYLAGWGVTIVSTNSDVNADGVVNGKDSMLLMQYFAGWAVTLQ